MTVIYEQREINNRMLLIQFIFPSHNIKINGSQVEGCSLDKYLTVDVWSQIYIKLESQLEKYKLNVKTRLNEAVITLRRAQLELNVSWKSKTSAHKEIADQEVKNCDLCPYVLVVKVSLVSAINQYKKQQNQETKTERLASTKPSTKSIKPETNEFSDNATSSNSSTNHHIEEYVPEAITNFDNIPKYTPSTLTSHIESKVDPISDEYDPSELSNPIDDRSETIVYTPTKIDPKQPKLHVKTDLNRNSKRSNKHYNDLFGDWSDEHEPEINLPSRLLRSTNKTTSKPQSNLDGWIKHPKTKLDNDQKENGRTNDQKKRKLNTAAPANKTPAELGSKDEESKRMRKLRLELEELENQTSTDHVIDSNLKDMNLREINDTFISHEEFLKQVFQKHVMKPDHKIALANENDYLLIAGLMTNEQVSGMYVKLRDEIEGNRKEALTSIHENLFWNILVPEWALRIFMDKFSLDREGAIKHIRKQNAARHEAEAAKFLIS